MSAFVEATWRKSSYSGGDHGNCVELAATSGAVGIRDGKNPTGGHLQVGKQALATLLNEVKTGRHDL